MNSASVNPKMGKKEAEAQPQRWLMHPVILPWDGEMEVHHLVGGPGGRRGGEHTLRCHK